MIVGVLGFKDWLASDDLYSQVLWGIATTTIGQRTSDDDDAVASQAVLAVWGSKGPAMVDAVALRAVQISDSLRAQEVSNVLWACATLRCRFQHRHTFCLL
jgi:hypothetical protein